MTDDRRGPTTVDVTSAGDVVESVRELRAAGRVALVAGGGTSLDVAADVHHDTRISTAGLGGVLAHEPADLTITCLAGTTLAELDAALRPHGQTLPVRHPEPDRATIGGLVASAWTGLGRRLYGRLRDRVLEVVVVTGEAKAVRGGGKVVKNVTGFDLPRLLCGSMGTLGVVVELTLKVHPAPSELFAVDAAGDPAELATWLTTGAADARLPTETVLVGSRGGWEAWAFAPGPLEDARALLAAFSSALPQPADAPFAALAAHRALGGGRGPHVSVRVAVPPVDVTALTRRLVAAEEVVLDAGVGVAWATGLPEADVPPLRAWARGRGGSVVVLRAPLEVRRRLGTWGRAPAGADIMGRLRASFDPDGVFAPVLSFDEAGDPATGDEPFDGSVADRRGEMRT